MSATPQQVKTFAAMVYAQAKASGHVWPGYAAAEAALESTWGTSGLAVQANNLFGMKQHDHPIFGTKNFPTKEFLKGQWVVVEAGFVQYPDWTACFKDRMRTLTEMAPHWEHYAAALAAKTGEEYVTQVSMTWSTDTNRAKNVIATYNAHKELWIG